MFCQKCGQQVPYGSTFCTHCGASLAGGSIPTPTGAGPSSAPGLTRSMPPVAPVPQKPKSKAPIVIAVACAAVVLLGGGTVFALTMLNGPKSSDTQISVIDTGSSEETGFVINLFGYVNINDETSHEMFVDADTSGKADLYTAEGDNWYVVSWRDGDTIIYEKTIVTDSTIATAHLEYSTANRDMGSKIIDTLLPTFQVD